MISKLKKKEGFTLIELLVVVAIVAMLSVMAVNGYMTYRRSAIIDLSADSLISQISEQRSRSIHKDDVSAKFEQIKKKVNNEFVDPVENVVPKCYGIFFLKKENGYEIYSFSQEFKSQKQFNIDSEAWEYKGCGDEFDVSQIQGDLLVLDELIAVSSVTDSPDLLVLRFTPPEGVLQRKLGNENFKSNFEPDEILSVVLRYGDLENSDFEKQVDIDLLNSNFTKKDVQATP